MVQLHPTEYQNHWITGVRSHGVAVGLLVLAASLGLGSLSIRNPYGKTALLIAALGAAGASRVAVENQVDKERIALDYRDISDAMRQQRLYESMRPQAEEMWLNDGSEGQTTLLEAAAPDPPPQRDVAGEIAVYDGHVGLIAKTRSGKTTLMIDAVQRDLMGGAKVNLIDGKGDPRLKKIQNIDYHQANRPDRVYGAVNMLNKVKVEMERRQDGADCAPLRLYVDELNCIRANAEMLDKQNKSSPDYDGEKLLDSIDMTLALLLLQGASVNIRLRISAHTSRVEDWGQNTGVLDSLSFIALGRNGAYESLEDTIQYQIKGRKSKGFQQQLDQYQQINLGQAPLILTTLHPIGFCQPISSYELPPQPPTQPTPGAVKPSVKNAGKSGAAWIASQTGFSASPENGINQSEQWIEVDQPGVLRNSEGGYISPELARMAEAEKAGRLSYFLRDEAGCSGRYYAGARQIANYLLGINSDSKASNS